MENSQGREEIAATSSTAEEDDLKGGKKIET